jgi:hypothetical protein
MTERKKLYVAAAMASGLGLLALVLVALPTWTPLPTLTPSVAASPQSTTGEIHLKPNRVLVVSGVQMRDDYVIHDAWDFGDVIALLKLWGIPFDTLRLDTQTMTLTHFLDVAGEARYGAIIWTARHGQYPWHPHYDDVLTQVVNAHHVSLIAIGEKVREPTIQNLLGIGCGDADVDCWEPMTATVTMTETAHFLTRGLSGTVSPGEAFPGGWGPALTVVATDVVTLATAGPWPQLTARTIDADSRTRAVWIGGDPYSVFHTSPAFIQLLRRSLVWAMDYGIYKDYGHSIVLRMDDPGGAPSAYWNDWHYPQLSAVSVTNSIITPLQKYSATLGVGFTPGYPLTPTCSITCSCLVDFVDPFGARQNVVATCAGLRDGMTAGIFEIQSHGLTHMVPDLSTPISGSTSWCEGSMDGEWAEDGWYREFCDTRRGKEVDAKIQSARLITSADWIEENFGVRPMTFIPPGHATSGIPYSVTIAITGAAPNVSYSVYYGKDSSWTEPYCSLDTDDNGDAQCGFTFPRCMFNATDSYFTINNMTGTQFIGGPIVEPPGSNFDFDLRDRARMTYSETQVFHLATDTLDSGHIAGFRLYIFDNYTYKLAGEVGYGLGLDDVAHYLGKDYVVTLKVCTAPYLDQDVESPTTCDVDIDDAISLQDNFDRGVPAVAWFHDFDFYRFSTDFLENCLGAISGTSTISGTSVISRVNWENVYYMSMDEWTGYMHARIDVTTPTTSRIRFDFDYDNQYCRYFDTYTSTWTLHLSDDLLDDLRDLGTIQIVRDGQVIGTVDAATYFTETQVLAIPPGVGSHTILFHHITLYLPLVMRDWQPVIRIQGRVTLENGTGLANVEIYSGVTYSPVCIGWLVTTTDENGHYRANINCPVGHDETLRVCPLLEGYTFVPQVSHWRTYGYCPDHETDFVAFPTR